MNADYVLLASFAFVAFVYASVGFGGGSSYLAILALFALPYQEMRLTALLCNIVVVGGNSIVFINRGQLNWRKNLPIVTASIPLAFLGARAPISEKLFFLLLGISLVAVAILLWSQTDSNEVLPSQSVAQKPVRDGLIGGSIGLLSGLVGIGGGIFLSPILHFMHWDSTRRIAATASFFILMNSLAGAVGQLLSITITPNWMQMILLGLAVLVGGQIGLRFSLKSLTTVLIRKLTAALVLIAGLEVLSKHLF